MSSPQLGSLPRPNTPTVSPYLHDARFNHQHQHQHQHAMPPGLGRGMPSRKTSLRFAPGRAESYIAANNFSAFPHDPYLAAQPVPQNLPSGRAPAGNLTLTSSERSGISFVPTTVISHATCPPIGGPVPDIKAAVDSPTAPRAPFHSHSHTLPSAINFAVPQLSASIPHPTEPMATPYAYEQVCTLS